MVFGANFPHQPAQLACLFALFLEMNSQLQAHHFCIASLAALAEVGDFLREFL
jgi:hypothetical protein